MEARYPYFRSPTREAQKKIAKEVGFIPVGFVATFERYVRPGIPTPSTALFQPIFEGGRVTEAKFLVEHPGYALGGLMGEWAQAKYIFGPIIEKIGGVGAKVYKFGHEKIGLKLPAWVQKRLWPIEYGRRQIERGISWGEQQFFVPTGHELSETMAKYWKYTGWSYSSYEGERVDSAYAPNRKGNVSSSWRLGSKTSSSFREGTSKLWFSTSDG